MLEQDLKRSVCPSVWIWKALLNKAFCESWIQVAGDDLWEHMTPENVVQKQVSHINDNCLLRRRDEISHLRQVVDDYR